MRQFSQLGQDLWVLSKYPNTKGYFVDIGFWAEFNSQP